ncbi:MAG: hypothetical protein MUO24_05125 [Desulfobacterales bacterium]|nr:hypothetical protein [Desulfobacterales bacterium]
MSRTVLVSGIIAICLFLGIATGAFAGIEPSPFSPIRHDLKLFQQEIVPSKGRLAEARPGADLTKLGLLKSRENMMGLLQSIRTKVKGLEAIRGQERGVLEICNKMKPKLDSLELFLKNFKTAIKQGDKPTAQGLLNQIGETVKALEALIAK